MFHSARLKLTVWYLLIITCISVSFSVAIYKVLTGEVDRFARIQKLRMERRFFSIDQLPLGTSQGNNPFFTFDPDLVEEVKQRLLFILVGVNGAILVLSGGLGYILAGRTLRPIQDMLDEQNRFISDASHELRTPLTSLKSAMEVYLRGKHPTIEETKKLITENIDEVNKLQSLSDELLQLAQYEKPNGHTAFETLSLTDIVGQAMKHVAPLAKDKKITIRSDTHAVTIQANAYSMIDLFVVLLDNAIKYSQQGKTVSVHWKKTDSHVVISIKDQGIGIDQKDLPHIFDRFYRASSARSKAHFGGYGLGLSIAKKIVAMHLGTITVESTLNKGSIFTISLPVKRSA